MVRCPFRSARQVHALACTGLALLTLATPAPGSDWGIVEGQAFHLELLDQIGLGPDETVTDVDVDGDLAYVGRGPRGLSIVDISEPGAMRLVTDWDLPGQLVVNDLAVANGRAYLTNEAYNGIAVYILDVRQPAAPIVIGAILAPLLNVAHNLTIDGETLYVVGHEGVRGWRTRIFDVGDPLVPVLLAELSTAGAHDITVLDGILYEGGGWGGLHIWDVRDPAHPVHLAAADVNAGPRPHFHAHSVWPTADRRHVLVMNEIESWWPGGPIVAGGMRVYRWDGAGALELAATWRTEAAQGMPLLAIHNVIVHGRHAFVSYYQAGVRVLDVADPEHPVEVGFFDTHLAAPGALFEGCWGVDLGAGNEPLLYASDRNRGLYQFRFDGARRALLAGRVSSAATSLPIPGAEVRLVSAGRRLFTDSGGGFAAATGEGLHHLVLSARGYGPRQFAIELKADRETEPLEIQLLPDGAVGVAEAAPAAGMALSLGPAFPNPFRSSVAIPFAPGGAARGGGGVRLTIHDAAGRCVRVLHDGPAGAEREVARWDGRDERGRNLPAGVYFTRLAAGGSEDCGRVELVR